VYNSDLEAEWISKKISDCEWFGCLKYRQRFDRKFANKETSPISRIAFTCATKADFMLKALHEA
jgi:hypothetical protein